MSDVRNCTLVIAGYAIWWLFAGEFVWYTGGEVIPHGGGTYATCNDYFFVCFERGDHLVQGTGGCAKFTVLVNMLIALLMTLHSCYHFCRASVAFCQRWQ